MGGGQNVVLNFLTDLFKGDYSIKYNIHFFIIENSEVQKFLDERDYKNYTFVPNSPIIRILWELSYGTCFVKRLNPDIIYTYFGYGFYPRRIPQISGSADSNLFFPEVFFWDGYKGLRLFAKNMIDKYRVFALKRVAGIIFETELLEQKCNELYKVKALTTTIRPSIKVYKRVQANKTKMFEDINSPLGLFLCGWQLNKNIMLIPKIAKILKNMGIKFHFIITAPLEYSPIHTQFNDRVNKYSVEEMITITGPVNKRELESLYTSVSVVFLLSKLESFSNNIIEAWRFHRPLICSDISWARSICQDAAYYVDRESAESIAFGIKKLLFDDNHYKKIVESGIEMLNVYPSIAQRTKEEFLFLETVLNSNA
jgi:glycosyltransferase involved in cell wall biosynthesis